MDDFEKAWEEMHGMSLGQQQQNIYAMLEAPSDGL